MTTTDSPEREEMFASSSPSAQTKVFMGTSGFSPIRRTVGKVTADTMLEIFSSSWKEKNSQAFTRRVNVQQYTS